MGTLRSAQASDQKAITAIIRAAHINPFNLNWQRFIVAVDGDKLVGVGQIKQYKDGCRELSSIAVIPACKHQGIASQIITALMEREKGTIHLFCQEKLADFYRRFGYHVIPMQELTGDVARIHSLGEWFIVLLARLFPKEHAIIAMRYDGDIQQ
ncbi:MAG: GNAT family N-acetyltransferase [Anaerolineales bacterium]|nr:GNAT family N-acetyltransferase [Anaerolineales bacterium]